MGYCSLIATLHVFCALQFGSESKSFSFCVVLFFCACVMTAVKTFIVFWWSLCTFDLPTCMELSASCKLNTQRRMKQNLHACKKRELVLPKQSTQMSNSPPNKCAANSAGKMTGDSRCSRHLLSSVQAHNFPLDLTLTLPSRWRKQSHLFCHLRVAVSTVRQVWWWIYTFIRLREKKLPTQYHSGSKQINTTVAFDWIDRPIAFVILSNQETEKNWTRLLFHPHVVFWSCNFILELDFDFLFPFQTYLSLCKLFFFCHFFPWGNTETKGSKYLDFSKSLKRRWIHSVAHLDLGDKKELRCWSRRKLAKSCTIVTWCPTQQLRCFLYKSAFLRVFVFWEVYYHSYTVQSALLQLV